jgi:tetratricopeptide (TPR) repeat protein
MGRLVLSTSIVVALALGATRALANAESDALRARATVEVYNLDRDEAISTFKHAITADPQDAAAYRGLAAALWLSITFRRGNMTVDDYLGRATRPNASFDPPPADLTAGFRDALEHALTLARARVDANARDADAHYQLGAAVGLRASYIATVEGRAVGAFRAAREAFEEHEKVADLDPRRKDAGLIVGTYRYVVSTLALPARWVAYVAGFGGGKEHGVRLIEEAANYPGDNQIDAKLALVLIHNRERRYDAALEQLTVLREQFPRNRLLWLETGSTNLRAGRPAEAVRFLDDGFSRFERDIRPRMFGEEALWYYKRGAARGALGRTQDAEIDLRRALSLEARKWVHGRTHLEIAKLSLKAGDRAAAQRALQNAVRLCEADNDKAAADEARRLAQ